MGSVRSNKTQRRRKDKGLCCEKYCRNKCGNKNPRCGKCDRRNRKLKNPLRSAYDVLKSNAKRRGKVFTITFEYFKKFAIRVDYIAKKGVTKYAYHIDRKNEELGYIPGNLQLLTNEKNVKKYLTYCKNERGVPVNFRTETRRKREPEPDDVF